VFVTIRTVIYCLGHGLHTFTVVPRSEQLLLYIAWSNECQAARLSGDGGPVGLDDSSIQVVSKLKVVSCLVLFYIHQMN